MQERAGRSASGGWRSGTCTRVARARSARRIPRSRPSLTAPLPPPSRQARRRGHVPSVRRSRSCSSCARSSYGLTRRVRRSSRSSPCRSCSARRRHCVSPSQVRARGPRPLPDSRRHARYPLSTPRLASPQASAPLPLTPTSARCCLRTSTSPLDSPSPSCPTVRAPPRAWSPPHVRPPRAQARTCLRAARSRHRPPPPPPPPPPRSPRRLSQDF